MKGNYFAALPVRVPSGWLETLQGNAPDGLRWFHPDDLHLTVAFFGKREEAHIPAIREILERIPFEPVGISFGNLLALPNVRRLAALSFALADGHDAVTQFIADWRGPLREAAGVDPDTRPPLPHLTVARPVRKHLPRHRRRILAWARSAEVPPGSVEVLAPALYGWSPDRPARQFAVIS